MDFKTKTIEKGCFENGSAIRYGPLRLNEKYYLNSIEFIIKDIRDPYVYLYKDADTLKQINKNSSDIIWLIINSCLLIFAVSF